MRGSGTRTPRLPGSRNAMPTGAPGSLTSRSMPDMTACVRIRALRVCCAEWDWEADRASSQSPLLRGAASWRQRLDLLEQARHDDRLAFLEPGKRGVRVPE